MREAALSFWLWKTVAPGPAALTQALHVSGSGFSSGGSGVEFFLKGIYDPPNNTVEAVDLSPYIGIQFKAKIGDGHRNPVRMNIAIPETESISDTFDNGGACDPESEGAESCDNHMGRFFWSESDNPGLAMPMSTEWQTFTFCFNKDLFPERLPSNLTAEQRRNLGRTFLKFQLQFNKSLDVSETDIDAAEPTLHDPADPFDLWVDDVTLIDDASLCDNTPTSG
jgi:hypothetical protein